MPPLAGSLVRLTRFPDFLICCLPVYLLLAFVRNSPSMGVLGSGDVFFVPSFRIILPNCGTLLFSDAGGLTQVLSGCFAEPLHKSELQGSFSSSAAAASGESALPALQDQQTFGLLFSCSCLVTFILTQVQN